MSAQPSSPAPEFPSSAPVHCRCDVVPTVAPEPIRNLGRHFGLTDEQVDKGWGTFGLIERDPKERELRTYLAADRLEPATPNPDATCPTSCVTANHPGREHDVWAGAREAERQLVEAQQAARLEQAQRPALGRIVHVLVHPTLNNGSDVASAVVTRVWQKGHDGTWIVNLRVFLDGTNRSHEWVTSVHLHATEAQARKEWVELNERIHGFEAEHVVGVSRFAFWPPRS